MAKKNTKENIFNVSIDLFSKYGYDGVSIRQIAKEVGIKESSIYNHYPSKESIMESILSYYISEMLKEEAPIMKTKEELDMDFDHFYNEGRDRFISKLSEEKMMKITRIFLVESYHNDKIKSFVKEAIIGYAINGWEELFELMKSKNFIRKDADSSQLAESFYYYGLFLLYEHFIINYPEDDKKFLKDFEERTTNHMKILFNSVKLEDKESKGTESNSIIRLEEEKDHLKVEKLVRDAFWNVYRPGAYEHYIVHHLRDDPSFIKDLAYLIEEDGEIIGHINYSKGELNLCRENEDEIGTSYEAAVLGPIAIDSRCQREGHGSRLIKHTLNLAREMDIPFVFVIGDEEYYSRFGFESASKYDIFLEGTDTEEENPFFMIRIIEDVFDGKEYEKGIFSNPDVFNVDEEKVDEFDKGFEYKEKRVQEGQLDIQ